MFKIWHLLAFMCISTIGFSQENGTIFDVARNGTVAQMKSVLIANPTAINNVNKDGFSALIIAIYRNNNQVAQFLIENGANFNENSPMGSPLMAATVKGNIEIARILLNKKADVNIADENGTTALIYAVQFTNFAIVELLLNNKVDKTHKDKQGKTAFEYAVFAGNEKIINQLK